MAQEKCICEPGDDANTGTGTGTGTDTGTGTGTDTGKGTDTGTREMEVTFGGAQTNKCIQSDSEMATDAIMLRSHSCEGPMSAMCLRLYFICLRRT